MEKKLDDELKTLDTSLSESQESTSKPNGLWHKAKLFTTAVMIAISSAFMTSCSEEKSDYQKASDNFIKAEKELKDAINDKEESDKHYEEALEEYIDAKADAKEESDKL